MTELKQYGRWLKSINDNFPNKGFEIEIVKKDDELIMSFTPRHTTPIIFHRDEKSVTDTLFVMHQTLSILQAVENDKSRVIAQGAALTANHQK